MPVYVMLWLARSYVHLGESDMFGGGGITLVWGGGGHMCPPQKFWGGGGHMGPPLKILGGGGHV